MTALVEELTIAEMVRVSQAERRELCVKTHSGSLYLLNPTEVHGYWRIVRVGCEGGRDSVTTDYGQVRGSKDGSRLLIGPWTTTGLADIWLT